MVEEYLQHHTKKHRATEQAVVFAVLGARTGWGKLCHVRQIAVSFMKSSHTLEHSLSSIHGDWYLRFFQTQLNSNEVWKKDNYNERACFLTQGINFTFYI